MKICLYHVFFPDNLVYYFFPASGEEIIEEHTSFSMCWSELLSVSKLICIVVAQIFLYNAKALISLSLFGYTLDVYFYDWKSN